MFEDKKAADAYDKMLELAECFSEMLMAQAESLSEKDAEAIGLLLSKNKEQLMTACKGKPEVLLNLSDEPNASADSKDADSNVTNLAVNS
jgi:dsDNA-binding SOS-regulon protein